MTVSPNARDLELFVACKSCGFPVATGLRMRAEELEGARLPPRAHRCPRCGASHLYAGEDLTHQT